MSDSDNENKTHSGGDEQSEAPAKAQKKVGFRSLYWLPFAIVLVGVDQLTKAMIVDRLAEYERITILPVFDIVRFHNTGAAFSLLADAGGWQNWFFTAVAVVISLGILWYLWSLPAKGARTLALGLSLVLSGAIGNLIDRLNYGYVVDFLLFHYQQLSWPAFNVADSAITIGVVLIIFDSLFLERRRIARLNADSKSESKSESKPDSHPD
jgi:signal peptidase II